MTNIRYDTLELVNSLLEEELVVCNLGIPSQELYAIEDRASNFYMLGSMGMVSSIALGLSLVTDKTVIALDGDGSVLMNLGSLTTVARQNPENFKWIVIDNGVYGSTGNQSTHSREGASLAQMARAAGIRDSLELTAEQDIQSVLKKRIKQRGLCFTVIKVEQGNMSTQRIPYDPIFIRNRFKTAVRGG